MSGVTVVIPTIGRPSLAATLESLSPGPEDRVMIMVDDPKTFDRVCAMVDVASEHSPATWRCYPPHEEGQLGAYGHPRRNVALDLLNELEFRPLVVWSLDDDDVATFGALDYIRDAAGEHPGALLIFRMRFGAGHPANGVVLPNRQEAIVGEVGTPMIVAPVGAPRFGMRATDGLGREHGPGYCGDFDYLVECMKAYGEPVWCDPIVCEVRP